MKFGAWMYQRDQTMNVIAFARVAEACGFESVWQGEHSHRPVTAAERPLLAQGKLHDHGLMWDQFVVLGAWAAVTSRVRLGTAITLAMERDPIWLAKEVATLDQISGGRAMLGIGGGHPREPYLQEMRNHGTDPETRFELLRERVLAIREIWTNEEPEFHGQYVNFDPIWSFPKPVQQPHPPVLLGSNGRTRKVWAKTLSRLLEYCDGWMPPAGEPRLAEKVQELQSRARELGRPRYDVTMFGVGMIEPCAEATLDRYVAAGVDRIIVTPPPAPEETVVPLLKQYGELAKRYE